MKEGTTGNYDAIIIGAGIGGLVCGCYLAKAGLKVLIAEQHDKPGGYCTSFRRRDFLFDAAADCFGAYRSNGIVRKVAQDLAIEERLDVLCPDPSNIVVTPEHTITFWNEREKTLEEMRSVFREEGDRVRNFFSFISSPDPASFARIRSWTFGDLLDRFLVIGTPETCIRQIQRIRDVVGITQFNCSFWFGDLEHARVLRSMERFARDVMPAFR